MEKKNRKLPRAAVEHLMLAAKRISQRVKDKTSVEIFKNYLRLMDKYSDYFFSEPWPKKYNYKRATPSIISTWILSMKTMKITRIGFSQFY